MLRKCSYWCGRQGSRYYSQLLSPTHIVICGGGILGTSVAYHLAELGYTDVTIIEQGRLTSGTTWHATGLVSCLHSTLDKTSICSYTASLYNKLNQIQPLVHWRSVGSLRVARTRDRMYVYEKQAARFLAHGYQCDLLTPDECSKYAPLIATKDLAGGLWVPVDGAVNVAHACETMANVAKSKGVKILENTAVKQVLTDGKRVTGVVTDQGTIECSHFINCAGLWARQVGKMSNPWVKVPLQACSHVNLLTKKVPEVLQHSSPIIWDFDGGIVFHRHQDGIACVGYPKEGKAVFVHKHYEQFQFKLLPENWDEAGGFLGELLLRMPCLKSASVLELRNGPESFSADNNWIVGQAPEIQNYYVAAGMNGFGVSAAGGIGKLVADLILQPEAVTVDMWSMDIRRFMELHNSKRFLVHRVKEAYSWYRMIQYPYSRFSSCRKLRTSPLYSRAESLGAYFDELMAYERPLVFPHVSARPMTDNIVQSFKKPFYFEHMEREYWACRQSVGLMDLSSMSKFEMYSQNTTALVEFLQYICSNNIDRPVGTVTFTGIQNEHGGFENDCSLLRLDVNYFLLICPTDVHTRFTSWIERRLPTGVRVRNVSSMYAGLAVIGPHAEELLQSVSEHSFAKADFPMLACKEVNIGFATNVKALRMTHAGEEGFMLYVPSEYGLSLYDMLIENGRDYGAVNVGLASVRCLRRERFIPYLGHDIGPLTTPLECNRDFRVRFDKPNFCGKAELMRQKSEGIRKRLVQFLYEPSHFNPHVHYWPHRDEPIYRNGRFCGMTTSAGFGFSLDRMVSLGYVSDFADDHGRLPQVLTPEFLRDGHYEIQIAKQRFPVKANLVAPSLNEPADSPEANNDRVEMGHYFN